MPSSFGRLLILAIFFLCGVILGQVFLSSVPASVALELTDYLRHYTTLGQTVSFQTVLAAMVLYFRYPVLAALFGFSSIGVVAIPCLAAMLGTVLSFSVSCFTASFGTNGVWLALAVLGLRCVAMLPCFFLLAVPAWEDSAILASFSFGKRRQHIPAVRHGQSRWLWLWGCMLFLSAVMCVDLILSPWLLKLAVDQVIL